MKLFAVTTSVRTHCYFLEFDEAASLFERYFVNAVRSLRNHHTVKLSSPLSAALWGLEFDTHLPAQTIRVDSGQHAIKLTIRQLTLTNRRDPTSEAGVVSSRLSTHAPVWQQLVGRTVDAAFTGL